MIEHGKVKQSCDLLMPTSSASQLSEAVTAITAFSNPVNLETIKSGGNECYVYGTWSPDFVRTVLQRDIIKCVYGNPQTFLPFRISSELNYLPLCPSCHAYFNHASNSGLVILLCDLGLFIQYAGNDHIPRISQPSKRSHD